LREEFILPIASFLARAWSGSKNVQVYLNSDIPYSNSSSVLLPMPSKFSKNKGNSVQVVACLTFHETQHIAFGSFDPYNKFAISNSNINFTMSSDAREVFINVLEDYRINSKVRQDIQRYVKGVPIQECDLL